MRRILVCPLIAVLLLVSFATIASAEEAGNEQETYKTLLQTVDGSITSAKRGDDPSGGLGQAQSLYSNLILGRYENRDFGGDREIIDLDNQINNTFTSLIAQWESAQVENIHALRSDISSMADKLGIGLSPIYEHAIWVLLGIAALLSLLITLLNKRVVNWEKVKQIKAETGAFQKELRDAQSKQDMKRVHKLQQEQQRILALQGEMMKETFKPTLLYIVPYFIFWFILSRTYSGWTVAWLPFNLPLHFFGFTGVSCGFLLWYMIAYFGFSQLWRKSIIGAW